MVRQPEGLHHLQVNTINSCSLHGWERGKFFTVIRPDIDQAAELVSLFLSCEGVITLIQVQGSIRYHRRKASVRQAYRMPCEMEILYTCTTEIFYLPQHL